MSAVYSRNVFDEHFKIKIGCLEGKRPAPLLSQLIENPHLIYTGLEDNICADLLIECTLESNSKQICPSMQMPYKYFTNNWSWNEWVEFPIAICDLSRDTVVVIKIYDSISPSKTVIVGQAFVSVFGHQGIMRTGLYDLRVWFQDELEQALELGENNLFGSLSGQDELDRLYELKSNYYSGQTVKIDWLDKLTFLEMEKITQRMKADSKNMFLSVEFPKAILDSSMDVPVVYYESMYRNPSESSQAKNDLAIINDSELSLENIIESKHHRLSRSARSCISDKDLKPNASVRDQLNTIVSYPTTKTLSSEEQDLVWKFRYSLMSQKKALAKFLKCLNWQVAAEVKIALELLASWQPMDTQDALELLSPQFQHPKVRLYAVARLRQATDEDLLLYLLQLVQALKYENYDAMTSHEDEQEWDLATFLIARCVQDDVLANYFYWYIVVEIENFSQSISELATNNASSIATSQNNTQAHKIYTNIMDRFIRTLSEEQEDFMRRRDFLSRQRLFVDKLVLLMRTVAKENKNRLGKIEKLKESLADAEALKFDFMNLDPPLSLPLDPNIKIQGVIPNKATLFKSQLMPCRLTLRTTVYNQKSPSPFMSNKLVGNIESTPPSDLFPLGAKILSGEESPYLEYNIIFKHGDDLRQDQLILQTITLMDKLLRRENLDLKLTPYRVLATSTRHGFVQYIESISLAEVRASEGSIQNFFRRHAPMTEGPYGISPEVMDTYVRSCAGYCVITYLLGVGDRHLDNLLLTSTGKLFHIDFGYILGRDPKPMPPPPMKLTREMVEAMGGTSSELYREFLNLSHTAFLHLRRHSNLILNLFSLMVDANVPDIALEPDKTVKKVQDKFRLDLSDEEAVHYIQNLIEISVSDVMAVLVEQIHKIAQYWRK